MARLIDANAFAEQYGNYYAEEGPAEGFIGTVGDLIVKQPTIEAEPVRHGRWIDTPLPNSRVAKCSLCGFWQRSNGDDKTGKHLIHNAVYRYCAGCGAKMDGCANVWTPYHTVELITDLECDCCGCKRDHTRIVKRYICPICGADSAEPTPFCPQCGYGVYRKGCDQDG